ncbi:MAG: sulfatase [Planctomycetes bacterium]|nr:sulfatase [Planctomycetota bacterium]
MLLIAIDGLRADHLSAAGYDRPTTPVLDALAKQGTLFTNAWSAAPRPLPAHAALLTGCDPWIARREAPEGNHASDPFAWRVPDGAPKLAQELLAHGYATAAFVGDPALSPVSGFGAGFQTYAAPQPDSSDPAEHEFEGVSTRFVNWLFEKSPSQDWFAYLHVDELVRVWGRKSADPRWDTYFPPRPELSTIPPVADGDPVFFAVPRARWPGGTLSIGEYEARYDGALCALDGKLGQLLERLRRTGRLKNTTVIVAGTFGTSFGESGLYLGSGTLSDVDLRVPLFVRPLLGSPMPRGQVSDALVSTIDVAPTILELERIGVPRGMHGESQLARLSGRAGTDRSVLFASGGLFPGWVAIDAEFCLGALRPRRRGRSSPLVPERRTRRRGARWWTCSTRTRAGSGTCAARPRPRRGAERARGSPNVASVGSRTWSAHGSRCRGSRRSNRANSRSSSRRTCSAAAADHASPGCGTSCRSSRHPPGASTSSVACAGAFRNAKLARAERPSARVTSTRITL